MLTLLNIRFFHGTRELHKTGKHAQYIFLAQTVTVTFESTKNGEKNVDITQHRTDKDLCPVQAWSSIVSRVLKYPGTNLKSPVNTVMEGGVVREVKSKEILEHIRNTVDVIGNHD